MTSDNSYSSIETEDPLAENALTPEQKQVWSEHLERVRQHCVEVFSASPLYEARAEKDPHYWENFSVGLVHMPGVETPQFH